MEAAATSTDRLYQGLLRLLGRTDDYTNRMTPQHPAAAPPRAAPVGSPVRAAVGSDQRQRHGYPGICRTRARTRCTDAGVWWNAIVMFIDSSSKRIDGRSRYPINTRSSCGSAWHNQAHYAVPAMTSTPSVVSAGSHEFKWKGIVSALLRQTTTARRGTCPTHWNYWMTRGGIRDG